MLDNSKRAKIFINAKGYPRYCVTKTLEDGSVIMTEGFSRRGLARGPPGSRKLKNALNGCDDVYFLQFISECLEWVPENRITPEQAIRHSWFKRRLPKLPHASSSSSSSYSGNVENKQPQSLNVTMNSSTALMNDSSGLVKESLNSNSKGITANCYYYDQNSLQLPSSSSSTTASSKIVSASSSSNNHHGGAVGSGAGVGSSGGGGVVDQSTKLLANLSIDNFTNSTHKALATLPNNTTFHHHQLQTHIQIGASKIGDKFYDPDNRKSLTLNRLMHSTHSSSTLSLNSATNNNINNNNNNNNNSNNNNNNTATAHLPQLN